ncbi:MAG: vitamin B12 dependent-methionine synthase activation domain-containing protein [Clostridia bacterium]|nr:vitamin B12 dependent-methionine synthase activation domain-containing protein [Clostridia bacterium]
MDKAEILRYLRTSSKIEDENVLRLVESCMDEINSTVRPKSIYRIFDCKVTESEVILDSAVFKSKRLAETVKGCNRVCIMGATLGIQGDRLLNLYAETEIARAAVMQSALASKIEEVCDSVEDDLRSQGLVLRQRYSPGYFDLDISQQRDIFSLIDITKRIGVTLTDTFQMIPTKSVTAIIGIDNFE